MEENNDQSSETSETTETAAPPPPKEAPALFYVHNTSRGRGNRTRRAQLPSHRGLKQYLGGELRLIRGAPLALTQEQMSKYEAELKEKILAGLIEVRTPDGRLINFETLETLAPPEVSKPLPKPPLDSIANDKQNVGQKMPQFAGGEAHVEDDPNKMPDLVAKAPVQEPEGTEGGPELNGPETQDEPKTPEEENPFGEEGGA
jgi:hypothetical protein